MIFKKLFGGSKPKPTGPQRIQSLHAGPMERDAGLDHSWNGKSVAVPLMGGVLIPVSYQELLSDNVSTLLPLYDAVLAHFLILDLKSRDLATPLVYKQCRDTIAAADWDGREALEIATREPSTLWAHVRPRSIFVTRRMYDQDEDLYLGVECECDWEEEHGLLLVYRQGKQLTRVSGNDGHVTDADALSIPDEDDAMLSAWKG